MTHTCFTVNVHVGTESRVYVNAHATAGYIQFSDQANDVILFLSDTASIDRVLSALQTLRASMEGDADENA